MAGTVCAMTKPTGFKRGFVHPCYSHKNWRKLRKMKLAHQPTCEICDRRNRPTIAVHVDHKVPLSEGGPWFPPLEELVSLCLRCHQLKTARSDHGKANQHGLRSAFAGTDIHGNPLDPEHPWNTS